MCEPLHGKQFSGSAIACTYVRCQRRSESGAVRSGVSEIVRLAQLTT